MNQTMGAGAYAKVGLESDVIAATPHRLICLLFDGVHRALRLAIAHLKAGRVAAKGEAITRALDIINNGLLAALDRKRGDELAERLAALYEYAARLVLGANLHNDAAALEEADRLLAEIGSAWRAIDPAAEHAPT